MREKANVKISGGCPRSKKKKKRLRPGIRCIFCWARPPTATSQVLHSNTTVAGYVGLQDLTPIHFHPSKSSKKKVRFDSE